MGETGSTVAANGLYSLAVAASLFSAFLGPVALLVLGTGVYVLREPTAQAFVYVMASDSGISFGQLSTLDTETGHVMLVQAAGAVTAFLGLLWLVTLL